MARAALSYRLDHAFPDRRFLLLCFASRPISLKGLHLDHLLHEGPNALLPFEHLRFHHFVEEHRKWSLVGVQLVGHQAAYAERRARPSPAAFRSAQN